MVSWASVLLAYQGPLIPTQTVDLCSYFSTCMDSYPESTSSVVSGWLLGEAMGGLKTSFVFIGCPCISRSGRKSIGIPPQRPIADKEPDYSGLDFATCTVYIHIDICKLTIKELTFVTRGIIAVYRNSKRRCITRVYCISCEFSLDGCKLNYNFMEN